MTHPASVTLKKVNPIDKIGRRLEKEGATLLAAWTQLFAAESFIELADSSKDFELTVFAFKCALAYEIQISKNIQSSEYLKEILKNHDSSELKEIQCDDENLTCEGVPLDASIPNLIKELGIHLSSLDFSDRFIPEGGNGFGKGDINHLEFDADSESNMVFFAPARNLRRLVIQQAVRRIDEGITFKVVIAEKWHGVGYGISTIYLIGRDASAQLFLNRLPREAEFWAIDACEAWIFSMNEEDILVKES